MVNDVRQSDLRHRRSYRHESRLQSYCLRQSRLRDCFRQTIQSVFRTSYWSVQGCMRAG